MSTFIHTLSSPLLSKGAILKNLLSSTNLHCYQCLTVKRWSDLTISDSSLEAQYTGTALRLESSLEANLGTVNRFCKHLAYKIALKHTHKYMPTLHELLCLSIFFHCRMQKNALTATSLSNNYQLSIQSINNFITNCLLGWTAVIFFYLLTSSPAKRNNYN